MNHAPSRVSLCFGCALTVAALFLHPAITQSQTRMLPTSEGISQKKEESAREGVAQRASGRRRFAVEDSVGATRIAGSHYARYESDSGPTAGFTVFSPDKEHFLIVTRKADLVHNTNVYTLLMFRRRTSGKIDGPRVLVSFASSSNREAIKDVSWVDDKTIAFLGEKPGEITQLYKLRCDDGTVEKLTAHPTSLVSYAFPAASGRIFYAAERPVTSLSGEVVSREGIRVSTENLADLIEGQIRGEDPGEHELFELDSRGERKLITTGRLESPFLDIRASPDGNYAIVLTKADKLRPEWKLYRDAILQKIIGISTRGQSVLDIMRYELVDAETTKGRVLVDAPVGYSGFDVAWSPDSRAAVLTGVHLPLDATDARERREREANLYAVEVEVPDGKWVRMATGNLTFDSWDLPADRVTFLARTSGSSQKNLRETVTFQKTRKGWEKTDPDKSQAAEMSVTEVRLDEDLNSRPFLVATDPATKEKTELLDLNPQFAELLLGQVREISWTNLGGGSSTGALYLPPDYAPGRQYPLVVQTHGYDVGRFSVDGPARTAFAAQVLANRGIVVVQVPDPPYSLLSTPREIPAGISIIEGAVSHLARSGLIDPQRVGIIGFSRTGLFVKYAITHPGTRYAAAIVADSSDVSYSRYMAFSNSRPDLAEDMEHLVGKAPFGAGLQTWFQGADGFMMDKAETPLLIQALGPRSLLSEWEWFSGLSRLKKPVELLYLPFGIHILERPSDRKVSEQATVDWFCFWLKGEEDADTSRGQQYDRWRELRKLLEKNKKKSANAASPSLN